jgi:hypothetical protein
MASYRIAEQQRRLVRRNYWLKLLLIGGAALIIGGGIGMVQKNTALLTVYILPALVSMTVVGALFFDALSKNILAICYIIENDRFIIKQNTYERLNITKDAIPCINQYQSLIMVLKTHKKIGIYPQVEHYHALLSALKGLGTVNELHKNRPLLLDYAYW